MASLAGNTRSGFLAAVLGDSVTYESKSTAEDDTPLRPIALSKLRHRTVAEVRAEGQPIQIPREIADMYADLTVDQERMVAAMWQILLEYRKLLKDLPERFSWKSFLKLMQDFAHAGTLDERTFIACVQEQYRFPHGYIEDEENEQLKLRKMAWNEILRRIESSLLSMFRMMATPVGDPPNDQLFLEVNDFEMCIYFLSEKEKPLHAIIARGTRIYNKQSKGPPLVHVRDMMKIVSLPVYRNKDRRAIALSTVQALESGLVPLSHQAPMHLTEEGVSMMLKASRLSKLLLRDPQASSLSISVMHIEAMYAPALRQKLLQRKQKLAKKRLADTFFLKKHAPVLFKHWKFMWRGKRRLLTALSSIERRITLKFSDLCLKHWRRLLLQTTSAVRVQCAFRGYRVRMAFFRASQAKFIADQIGRLYAWKIRGQHEAHQKVMEDLASVQIQKIGRGVVTRKRLVNKYIATPNPPYICLKLKLMRDGNLNRHSEALIIQCAYRRVCAMRIADKLWTERHESERRAMEEDAKMRAEHSKDLAAIRVVERMVDQQLKKRLKQDQAIAAAIQAARDVSTLRSRRRHEEKKRQLEEEAESVRKRQAKALLDINAEWDDKMSEAKGKEREKWEAIIFFKRPEDGTEEQLRAWDSTKAEYMDIAKQLTAKRRNNLEQNIVDAKNALVDERLKSIKSDISTQRAAARKKVAADLAGKLGAFREERVIATSSGETAATKTICDFILRCQQRAAIRAVIRESWRKHFDLLQGEYCYFNEKGKLRSSAKPMLLGDTDVEIQNRWEVLKGHYEGRDLKYFFNPRTHTLSWTQPQYTVICPRCSNFFVDYTCNEGCGDMCTRCWSEAHPSADADLAIHSWSQKLGGRAIHTLDQYDNTDVYLAGVVGDEGDINPLTAEQRAQYAARESFAESAETAEEKHQQIESDIRESAAEDEGYYDESGGYVWPNGGYTSPEGDYYAPDEGSEYQ